MDCLLKNANVYIDGSFRKTDIFIKDDIIVSVDGSFHTDESVVSFDFNNKYIFPGFTDVHVHLREPGFLCKETIETGTRAAARGGYTSVCAMPNLKPVPDSAENIKAETDIIEKTAVVHVYPYGAITVGEMGQELAALEDMAPYAIAFSDDGHGVQRDDMMRSAMTEAKRIGKMIVAHCEDESLLCGGYIHDGEYARLHGHKGISSASEYRQVARDVELVRATGVQYHVCHISTKETVDIVRKAKAEGLSVSCETGPHYLAFCDMDLQDEGRFKMNPPIRSAADRDALIQGIKDGTIEVIATDHAPHSRREKTKGLAGSSMGVVGLETSFAAVNTYMVQAGHIGLEKLVEIMSINPRKIFGLDRGIKIGQKADFTVVDTQKQWVVDPAEFVSAGKFTPFEGVKLTGDVLLTVYDGELVYNKLI